MKNRLHCEICQDRRTIQLPVYAQMQFACINSISKPINENNSRTYPCPECSDTIPQQRLAIVEYYSLVNSEIDNPEFIQHSKRRSAEGIAVKLLEDDFIRFERGPNNTQQQTYPIRAVIGVISPIHVATFEQRIAEHEEKLANEVIVEATKQIQNWRSAYDGKTILKSIACDFITEALKTVLNKRKSTKV